MDHEARDARSPEADFPFVVEAEPYERQEGERMMSSRDAILARSRANRPAGQHDLPTVPDFTRPSNGGVQARFIENLKVMGGDIMEQDGSGDLLQPLRTRLTRSSVICST